ncbi:hypothetical protein FACUT_11555 [Fusarium acutatum]|uniref:Uncharacterized protein n=1 Tax=Fusarium acutatum TaxID=78861 RepID=A0A8H4NCR4_9HYPO|nr:hypothetical protein FACUT_11555 [Fusarium acutatum]
MKLLTDSYKVNRARAHQSSLGMTAHVTSRIVVSQGSKVSRFDDSIAIAIRDLFNWLKTGVEKVVNFVKNAATGIWDFIIKIGNDIYRTVLNTIDAVVGAVEWVFDKIRMGAAHNLVKYCLTDMVSGNQTAKGELDECIESIYNPVCLVRDEWQKKLADFEEQLSKAMGVDWKVDIDALAVAPYGAEISWASRVLTMDVDEEGTFDACGAQFTSNGKLAIVFGADRLGSNTDDAFWNKNMERGISLAPSPDALSFYARKRILEDYEPDIADVQSDLKDILHEDINLHPHFEEVYEKLKQTKDGTDFGKYFGTFMFNYFRGLVSTLKWRKFDSDDMLQEALNEVMEKGEVHFRVLDTVGGSSREAAIEDGILYLQTSPDKWGSNIEDISNNIIDIL